VRGPSCPFRVLILRGGGGETMLWGGARRKEQGTFKLEEGEKGVGGKWVQREPDSTVVPADSAR